MFKLPVAKTATLMALGLCTMNLWAQSGGAGSQAGRPNILLIVSDDIGTDVTSSMYPGLIDDLIATYGPSGRGHDNYQAIDGHPASTPNLKRLAQSGMRFTNVWAHPFCSPTRAALLTGLYAADTRVANYQDALSQNHTSFVRILKEEGGYSTGLFGKWHLAGLPAINYSGMKPKEAGFDIFKGNMHAALGTFWDYDYQMQLADTPADEWIEQAPPERSLPGVAPTTYAPVVKIADTLEWIGEREDADGDKPWFAWLAFNLSHATSQRLPTQMAVPEADTLDAQSRAEVSACGGVFGTQDYGDCPGEVQMRAMTNSLDTILGKLIDAVDAMDPNTYVIFIGDNGTPMYGRPGLDFIDNMYITRSGRGKGTVFESGALVPMFIRGPGIEAGSESREFAHAVDVFATTLSLAGLQVPAAVSNSEGNAMLPLASVSQTPILFGRAASVRNPVDDFILTETHDLMRGGIREVGARNGTHKVLCTDAASAATCSFYDLSADPLEEYPLAKPEDCSGADRLKPADSAWHFCRLLYVVDQNSFL